MMVIPTNARWSMSARSIGRTLAILIIVPLLSGCGVLFVNGPPTNWQSAPDLETIALTQPCTNSKTLVALDAVLAGVNGILGIVLLTLDGSDYPEAKANGAASLIWAGAQTAGAVLGNGKVGQCRAFNARLIESRRGDEFGQATYNWLDEFSPVPDFGANALFPVRSLSLNR
jgi:hypothetical protein